VRCRWIDAHADFNATRSSAEVAPGALALTTVVGQPRTLPWRR
jgi:hypothetical protein